MRRRFGVIVVGVGVFLGRMSRLGRSRQPIGRARFLDRRFRDLRQKLEMSLGAGQVVEEAQGDPAGVEFRFDPRIDAMRGMLRADRIGALRVAEVEQFSRDKAALDPPGVAVDHALGLARGVAQQRGGLGDFLLLAQEVHARVDQAGIVLERRRHRGEEFFAAIIAIGGGAHPGQGHDVLAGEFRGAHGRRVFLGVEQAVGAVFVIGDGQEIRELLAQHAFDRFVEVFLAP